MLCRHVKNKLRRPKDLAIVLAHNYTMRPIMARSLDYAGIHDYITLRPETTGPWRHVEKLIALEKLLDSSTFKEEYLLFADCMDAVIRDDPAKAVPLLERYNCQALFCATANADGYRMMPEQLEWADKAAGEHAGLYLNAGVFVARVSFLRELVARAMAYVTDADLDHEDYQERIRELGEVAGMAGFPTGYGSDQVILRYLLPQFGSRIAVDYEGLLAHRTTKARIKPSPADL